MIEKDITQIVAQSNELLRSGRDELTTRQKKILVTAISKIKPEDAPGTHYELSIPDLCDMLGVPRTGREYKDIVADTKALRDFSVWMPENGNPKRLRTVSWLTEAIHDKEKGTMEVIFDPIIEEHLFELYIKKIPYAQYKLEMAMVFENRHTLDIYEYLLSHEGGKKYRENGNKQDIPILLEDFRKRFLMDKERKTGKRKQNIYTRWYDIKKNIIEKAVEEINKYSDIIRVSYTYTTRGGRPTGAVQYIIFTISKCVYPDTRMAKKEVIKRENEIFKKLNERKERVTEKDRVRKKRTKGGGADGKKEDGSK